MTETILLSQTDVVVKFSHVEDARLWRERRVLVFLLRSSRPLGSFFDSITYTRRLLASFAGRSYGPRHSQTLDTIELTYRARHLEVYVSSCSPGYQYMHSCENVENLKTGISTLFKVVHDLYYRGVLHRGLSTWNVPLKGCDLQVIDWNCAKVISEESNEHMTATRDTMCISRLEEKDRGLLLPDFEAESAVCVPIKAICFFHALHALNADKTRQEQWDKIIKGFYWNSPQRNRGILIVLGVDGAEIEGMVAQTLKYRHEAEAEEETSATQSIF